LDIAVDPIDGTRLVAFGLPNAISVIAATERGGIEYLPTYYSYKLAVGPELAGKLDIKRNDKRKLASCGCYTWNGYFRTDLCRSQQR